MVTVAELSCGQADVESIPDIVAGVARGLRPIGLWYAAMTTVVGVLIWGYNDTLYPFWPVPFRCLLWTWLVATMCAVPYIFVAGLTGWLTERVEATTLRKPPHLAPPTPPTTP